MKRLKLRTRFFVYHTGIIVLITIGLVGYIYKVVVSEMKKEDEQHFQLIAQKTAAQLDSLYYNMDWTAMQIAMNPDIVRIFQNLPAEADGNYFMSHPDQNDRLKSLLGAYNLKADENFRILLYNQYGDFSCIAGREFANSCIQQFFSEDAFWEVQNFFSGERGHSFYRKPVKDVLSSGEEEAAEHLAVVREIRDYSSESRYGYVEVQESVKNLERILSDMGEENYAHILDLEGNVIYRSCGKSAAINYEKNYQLELALEHAPYMVKFYKRPIKLEQELQRFYLILALVVAAITAAALALERILFRYFSRPLIALDQSLTSVAMDNLCVDIADENSDDIIIRLEDSFNTMLEKLNDSMQLQIAAKTNEVKAHLFALQSQMNPHFLHNILAIISMEAQIDGNTRIPYICKGLGEILRYTSEMGDGFSTIKEECENAERYMLLMKVRYEDLFEYKIQIEEDAREVRVPKLIVQPICENCFRHGFKKVEPTWRIFLHAWVHEGKWYILIRDNGGGFSDDFLEDFHRLSENLDQADLNNILNSISIGGLCIPNIYTRMKITYGKDFIFELHNEEKGASVLLGGGWDD